MMNRILKDKTYIVEILSIASFFLMSFAMMLTEIGTPIIRSAFFWAIIFLILASIHTTSLIFQKELWIVRICSTWFSGTTWILLSYTIVNNVMMIPIMMIGILNLYSFTILTDKIKVDWSAFKNIKHDHANTLT